MSDLSFYFRERFCVDYEEMPKLNEADEKIKKSFLEEEMTPVRSMILRNFVEKVNLDLCRILVSFLIFCYAVGQYLGVAESALNSSMMQKLENRSTQTIFSFVIVVHCKF